MIKKSKIQRYKAMSGLVTRLRMDLEDSEFVLIYAYNGIGKTRLCGEFKDRGKNKGNPDTLYFNAFTEDLFTWDNDLDNDQQRVLRLNTDSSFFAGLIEMEMDTRIRPLLDRYTDFDFRIDTEIDEHERITKASISFSRKITIGEGDEATTETVDGIKISRGEENIFIWCFFLAIVQLVLDEAEAYQWVKYLYIDDPISSLDEQNAIAVATHLARLLKEKKGHLKTVISTHHTLFFNVLFNELKKKATKYFLSRVRSTGGYTLCNTGDTPFFQHVAALTELYEADRSGEVYTHHFNMLRSIIEKTASFHGYKHFSACIKKDADDVEGVLHTRIVNLLSHGNYSLYEPREMLEENKEYFRKVLHEFITRFPFDPDLFPSEPEKATAS